MIWDGIVILLTSDICPPALDHAASNIFRDRMQHIYLIYDKSDTAHCSLPIYSSTNWCSVVWPHSNGSDFCGSRFARMYCSISVQTLFDRCRYAWLLCRWRTDSACRPIESHFFRLHPIGNFHRERWVDDRLGRISMQQKQWPWATWRSFFEVSICLIYKWCHLCSSNSMVDLTMPQMECVRWNGNSI